MKKQLTMIAAGGALLLTLAGCSATDAAEKPTASPSASASAGAEVEEYVFPEVNGECVDGIATIADDASSSIITVGDCETVVVEASNSKVILGTVDHLTVNSSISLIETTSVGHIVFGGQGNFVVTPGEPVLEGDVENNTVGAEAPAAE
ncbi:hypothetical protein KXS11_09915 [Plantibacter flavus]|uniref:hypothetical protein n=1 Tax=Plantibacter flavus TaxID=150123 RepID=UPI003F170537